MNEMLIQFNLPKYIDGLSFADASKKIQSRFKDRVDKESVETQRELLERLRDMQEHVKQVQAQKEQIKLDKERDPNAMIAGESSDSLSNISSEESQNIEESSPYEEDMMSQIQNAYGGYSSQPTNDQLFGTSNKFWSGGYEDEQNSYLSQMPQEQVIDPNQSQQSSLPPSNMQQSPSSQNISSIGSLAGTAGQMIGGSKGGSSSSMLGGSGSGPGVGGYAQMAGTALELGNEAFGPTGVNTSGAARVKPKKAGNAALSGAAKGATAGAVLGPWGAAAGAVVGAAAGYIGAKKQQKQATIANRNATYADASKNDNQFADGGPLPLGRPKPEDSLYGSILNNYDTTSGVILPDSIESNTLPTQTKAQFEKYYADNSKTSTLDNIKSGALKAGKGVLKAGKKGAEYVGDNLDMLRYAPVLGNVMQLANLKKPEQETTRELSNRYEKQLIDENALVNLVREETNANREAILSSSGGSGATARANLLGSQLNSTKAISDAYLKSAEINAQEGRQEQAFNLGVDTTNLSQSNLAQDIRARNKGNYETQKSMLQSAVATDLGSIGQEELYKKFPELLGMDYDWKGKYQKLKEETDKKKK